MMTFQSTLSIQRVTFSMVSLVTCPRFQSTLSIQRVTMLRFLEGFIITISIHTLHTESDTVHYATAEVGKISIHTLHTESDVAVQFDFTYIDLFQSTLSIQRVTRRRKMAERYPTISIHTLHTESD